MRNLRAIAVGLGTGALATVGAVVVSLRAAGAGHGSYVPAVLLFPYTMLSARWSDTITIAAACVGLAQFSTYGLVIAWAAERQHLKRAAAVLATLHIAGVVACLLLLDAAIWPVRARVP